MKNICMLACLFALSACGGGGAEPNKSKSFKSVAETTAYNEDLNSAQEVPVNSNITGAADDSVDAYDFYQFSAKNKSKVTITLTSPAGSNFDFELWGTDGIYVKSNSEKQKESITETIFKGVFFIRLTAKEGRGEYQLKLELDSVEEE